MEGIIKERKKILEDKYPHLTECIEFTENSVKIKTLWKREIEFWLLHIEARLFSDDTPSLSKQESQELNNLLFDDFVDLQATLWKNVWPYIDLLWMEGSTQRLRDWCDDFFDDIRDNVTSVLWNKRRVARLKEIKNFDVKYWLGGKGDIIRLGKSKISIDFDKSVDPNNIWTINCRVLERPKSSKKIFHDLE